MNGQQEQQQQHEPPGGSPGHKGSGEGSESAFSAMVKKRREGQHGVNDEEHDATRENPSSNP